MKKVVAKLWGFGILSSCEGGNAQAEKAPLDSATTG